MIKKIVVSALLLFVCQFAQADRYGKNMSPKDLRDYIDSLNYDVVQYTTAPVGSVSGSKSFVGHGTDLHIYYKGNAGSYLNISTSSVSGGEDRNIIDGEIYEHNFYVPYSSPTVVRYSLIGGCTFHLTIGGLKK